MFRWSAAATDLPQVVVAAGGMRKGRSERQVLTAIDIHIVEAGECILRILPL